MMFPIIQIGGFALQTPGLILLVGIWVGLSLAERYAKSTKVNTDQLYNLTFAMLVAGILGARLAVMVRFPSAFVENPASALSLNPSLLDPVGGLATALIAGLVYGQRKGMELWATLDALVPTMGVMGIAIPLANLASGSAFGSPSELPWAIELWGTTRHPTQIYQALTSSLILWLVWPNRQGKNIANGVLFLKYSALSAATILLLEAFRGDSLLILNGLRSSQVTAWIILAVSLWGYSSLLPPTKR